MALDAQRAYREALPAGTLIEFPTTALDQAGIPAHSVTLIDPSGPWYGGLGFGLTPDRAALGALGEMVEGVGARVGMAALPRRIATFAELTGEQAVDPVLLGLPAGSPHTCDTPLEWVPMRRLGDDQQRWVPAEFVASTPSDLQSVADVPRLVTPVTNGLGAGTTPDMAVLHGLLEVLQRDGNGLTIRAADTGVGLRLDVAPSPSAQQVLDRLAAAGITVTVKLASTDFGASTVVVTGMAPGDDVVVATSMGEGTSLDPQRALLKALLEFAGARPRKRLMFGPLAAVQAIAPPGYLALFGGRLDLAAEEPRALAAMTAWVADPPPHWPQLLADTIFRVDREVAFSDLPPAPGADDDAAVLALLRERLEEEGYDVLVAHLLDAGDVHVARVVVPGLEVETLSYLRLGARNAARLLARQEAGTLPVLVRTGAGRPGDLCVSLTAAAQEELGGPVWLDPTALAGLVGAMYPLYREPSRHAVQVALGRA